MEKIEISWVEYTHKFKGCGNQIFPNEFSQRNLKRIAEWILAEGLYNFFGWSQTVYCRPEECESDDYEDREVPTEVIKQILVYYIETY